MELLLRVFGWPHELLHVLALRLIGRRPSHVTRSHVDIPADLSTREYVFVAGLPAAVFGVAMSASVVLLFDAPDVTQTLLWLALSLLFALATVGTAGDVHLIIERLLAERQPPDETA